jgi:hypothetical protein
MFRREDGTVLTRDCPVGVRYFRQRLARAVAAIVGVVVTLVGGTLFGGILNRTSSGSLKAPSTAFAQWIDPPRQFEILMGAICLPPQPAPPQPMTPGGEPLAEPAETPLPEPTPEQLREIQGRLEQ